MGPYRRCSHLCTQGVLRRWFARLPEVVDTVSNLVSNAEAIRPAVLGGDVTMFGQCVSNYWSQKKLMAGDGVEPTLITRALAAVAPASCCWSQKSPTTRRGSRLHLTPSCTPS